MLIKWIELGETECDEIEQFQQMHPNAIILHRNNSEELKKIRATINGKLSKRVITPEQQVNMQAGRKQKKEGCND